MVCQWCEKNDTPSAELFECLQNNEKKKLQSQYFKVDPFIF